MVNARFWRKIMNMDPKQVNMVPFWLIFIQDGSHKLWEASGMPPGPQKRVWKITKIKVFHFFQYFLYFSIIPQQQHACGEGL